MEGVQPEFSYLCNQLLASLIDKVEAQVRKMDASAKREAYRAHESSHLRRTDHDLDIEASTERGVYRGYVSFTFRTYQALQ